MNERNVHNGVYNHLKILMRCVVLHCLQHKYLRFYYITQDTVQPYKTVIFFSFAFAIEEAQ